MRAWTHLPTTLPAVGLLLVGFGAGVWTATPATPLAAQQGDPVTVNVSEDTAEKIKQASGSVAVAQAALEQEGLYIPAIRTKNAYAVFCGGLDAVSDLEKGRGVDPITFAGLHVGLAVDDIAVNLGTDENGRLTYKGKLVRIYSIDHLKELEARQAAVLDISAGGRQAPGASR